MNIGGGILARDLVVPPTGSEVGFKMAVVGNELLYLRALVFEELHNVVVHFISEGMIWKK